MNRLFEMNSQILITVVILSTFYGSALSGSARIVGGTPAAIPDFPYQLSLLKYFEIVCGASLISDNWALTAAHCVNGSDSIVSFSLRAGSSSWKEGGLLLLPSKVVIHPQYNRDTHDYDFALIQMGYPAPIGQYGINTISLADDELVNGTLATVSGWGTLTSGSNVFPEQLYKVDLPLITRESCQRLYEPIDITNNMICANDPEGGKDSCVGDAGGPLVTGGKQIGVTSWGYGCGNPKYPGVYGSIPAVRSWIKEISGI